MKSCLQKRLSIKKDPKNQTVNLLDNSLFTKRPAQQINNYVKSQQFLKLRMYKESSKLPHTPIAITYNLSKAEFIIAKSNAC